MASGTFFKDDTKETLSFEAVHEKKEKYEPGPFCLTCTADLGRQIMTRVSVKSRSSHDRCRSHDTLTLLYTCHGGC